jgi:hypothetical protein
MDAFFESPKHGNTNNNSASSGQQQQVSSNLETSIIHNEHMDTESIGATNVLILNNNNNNTNDLTSSNNLIELRVNNSNNNNNNDVVEHHAAQLTELTGTHVKLEMENGQVVVVDQSQLETVVVVDPSSLNFGNQQQQQQQQQVGVSLSDTAGLLEHQHDSSLIITSNALGKYA